MAGVRPEDFLDIDSVLSDEERDIRDAVRAFVRREVVPNVGEWFEQGTIPRELAPALGALGVLGMHLQGYGCAGASATAYGLGVPGAGGRRQRRAQPRVGAGVAGDVCDPSLGL